MPVKSRMMVLIATTNAKFHKREMTNHPRSLNLAGS